MAQYAYPDADTSDGNWVTQAGNNTNLYASIDDAYDVAEGVADNTYITVTDDSMGSPEATTVSLSAVTDPSSASAHSVVVLWDDDGGMGGVNLNVNLKDSDGGSVKNQTFSVSSAPDLETSTMTLNTSEANGISGYDNLILVLTATDSGGMGTTTSVYRAYFTCPDAASSSAKIPITLFINGMST
jgi:hypothetical protein